MTPEILEKFRTFYPEKTMPRTCGSCYACCVWLGIEELKKKTGKPCHHLNGQNGPEKRCGIYPHRPAACQRYHCAYIEGLGNDETRPDQSGFITTPYARNITIQVFDEAKSGDLSAGLLANTLQELLAAGGNQVAVVFRQSKKFIYFSNGEIRLGKLHPQEKYEDLNFEVYDPPIGKYEVK